VEAVGPGVDQFHPGDRVAYMNAGVGAYADYRNVQADRTMLTLLLFVPTLRTFSMQFHPVW